MDYSNWMASLPDYASKAPINHIAIPGTHDTFTYSITENSTIAPNARRQVMFLVDMFGKPARRITANWAIIQDEDTTTQLNSGIRYFDARVATRPGFADKFYFCHSLYANSVIEEIIAIKRFLDSHPKEVVIFDAFLLYAMTAADYQDLIILMQTVFGNMLVPYQNTFPSLQDMWKNKQQLIFIMSYPDWKTLSNVNGMWPGEKRISVAPPGELVKPAIQMLSDEYSKGHPDSVFYVFQGKLSPNGSIISQNLCSTIKRVLCEKMTPAFIYWLKDKVAGRGKINICFADFVGDYPQYMKLIVAMNHNPLSFK